ncbi:glycosyltransferase family 4 protein [Geobacter pickeringii]|uniref:Glycosyl transferase family 1 domain-containing protein n=1 Tax=Geobacter pickeringii TaxID=345632 RepID=A0A0B5BET4_9BACT|nr:glycosyltransferase family 1 protein [Geobacter pickeringii]AJE03040.1 hypothetical protein GPICK_06375 [Geobacter pickeringii]
MCDLLTIGIDASNIRAGGGLTHLKCLLDSTNVKFAAGLRMIIWGGSNTLDKLPSNQLVEKIYVPILNKSLCFRVAWQAWFLPSCLKEKKCDILFSPGGTLPPNPGVPTVVMSQNLLPFEPYEARRFGFSFMSLKMKLLHVSQKRSFEQSDGIIFLTRYAQDSICAVLSNKPKNMTIIPHGIEDRFYASPRSASKSFSLSCPFRVIYVSIVDVYKHQWHVAEAAASLRLKGIPLQVEFIGPCYPQAGKRLADTIARLDPCGEFLIYHGPLPFEQLEEAYQKADAFVFASSCENLPNILLEAMASGLPIACSGRGPMPEVLGDAGIYFDPEKPDEIATALMCLYRDSELRLHLATEAHVRARAYSWGRCALETFSFIEQVASDAKV